MILFVLTLSKTKHSFRTLSCQKGAALIEIVAACCIAGAVTAATLVRHNKHEQLALEITAQVTAAGTVAQTLEVHQDASENNTGGAFEETFTEPLSGMEFILVRGGCYQMGSNLTAFEGPVHEVCLDDFYLSKYEVTQRQWKILMGRDFLISRGMAVRSKESPGMILKDLSAS